MSIVNPFVMVNAQKSGWSETVRSRLYVRKKSARLVKLYVNYCVFEVFAWPEDRDFLSRYDDDLSGILGVASFSGGSFPDFEHAEADERAFVAFAESALNFCEDFIYDGGDIFFAHGEFGSDSVNKFCFSHELHLLAGNFLHFISFYELCNVFTGILLGLAEAIANFCPSSLNCEGGNIILNSLSFLVHDDNRYYPYHQAIPHKII